ncbi:MAG TPA: formylglycine-generating enzyme family protein [Gemmatimonadaceae bacterium]|nr:formylglycine-generating enzyme family protein [Gemmatimonadaceae bacterium]
MSVSLRVRRARPSPRWQGASLAAPRRLRGLVASVGLLSACISGDEAPLVTVAPGAPPPGMVWIPGGTFWMGDDGPFAQPGEGPVHRVQVDGFFMDAEAVTNEEFGAFVAATGYVTVAERTPRLEEIMSQLPAGSPAPPPEQLVPGSLVFTPSSAPVDLRDPSRWWRWVPGASWRHPGGPGTNVAGRERHPVVHVAWEDAVTYASWAGGRLPTEAEWEYAARGGREREAHVWGNAPHDPSHPRAHIYPGPFPARPAAPAPVGSYAPNAFGLYDMSGNVWQWTLDRYAEHTYARDHRRGVVRNPTGPTEGDPGAGTDRVIRGGSFLCSDEYCRGYRVSARSPGAPDTGAEHIGFRVVMTTGQYRLSLPSQFTIDRDPARRRVDRADER